MEDKFAENKDADKHFSELDFLNHRLEKLVSQKVNCKYLLVLIILRNDNDITKISIFCINLFIYVHPKSLYSRIY